ncbi:hypothetical protein Nizo2259_2984 [Lactiplantibacillus plantarum]|uniref:Uncharacterized protein n=1 Tax=Lactiplantibacillus plantarum TaxID=1590 RepID=A0A162ETF3_LACPN|nr:hypothetical protein [Lactiplantibacillus plantarum]MBG1239590.1 hypothetical protein [Lactiplantibacillus plantarum subsp. plantarum]KEZ14354.1 hypothetical protein Lp90_1250 [Lactiplantibacillus plantarum]KZD98796.1 hypothetical protein FBR6_1848 [Lactiplantibacillus plantarum]KZT93496.1 hypothetical protein Nizo2259_2984 [Lactiplantibacillus plantarum]KZU30352.1 hypothetical protein Nizo2535_1829 [Lactiplantibacillus plantarum]
MTQGYFRIFFVPVRNNGVILARVLSSDNLLMVGTEIVALFELRGRYWYYQFELLSCVTTDSCLGQWLDD